MDTIEIKYNVVLAKVFRGNGLSGRLELTGLIRRRLAKLLLLLASRVFGADASAGISSKVLKVRSTRGVFNVLYCAETSELACR